MFLLKVMYMWCQQKLHKDMLKVLVNMEFGVSDILFGTECIITIGIYLVPGKLLSGKNTHVFHILDSHVLFSFIFTQCKYW